MVDITIPIILLIISNALVISLNIWAWVDKRIRRDKEKRRRRKMGNYKESRTSEFSLDNQEEL